MLIGECPDSAGPVGDSRASALVGVLLADEQQEAGGLGTADPSVCGISSASVKPVKPELSSCVLVITVTPSGSASRCGRIAISWRAMSISQVRSIIPLNVTRPCSRSCHRGAPLPA